MARTLTAAIGIIKSGGITIGKMRDIQIRETIGRARVVGIGELVPSEIPATSWQGQLSCSFFTIDFERLSTIPNAIVRRVGSVEEFVNTVVLQDDGVDVTLYKKVANGDPDPITGVIEASLEQIISVRNLFLDSESISIPEGGVSTRQQSFAYKTPALYII